MQNSTITKEKLSKYFSITEQALKKAKISKNISTEENKNAKKLIDMAKRYFSDAKHFEKKGKIVDAFSALNVSHTFLDACALLKWLDVKDSKLFMVD